MGMILVLKTNIRLARKNFLEANSLAYFSLTSSTKTKRIITFHFISIFVFWVRSRKFCSKICSKKDSSSLTVYKFDVILEQCVYKTSKDVALTCQGIITEGEGSVPLTSLY